MDNENLNSAESTAADKKPGRSKVERAVVWTVIVALIVVTGVEALARTSYSRTLSDFESAMDTSQETLTLDDFKSNIKSGMAIQMVGEHEGQRTVLFRWPSVLRKYDLHLTVGPDGQRLLTYATSEGPAGRILPPIGVGDDSEAPDEDMEPVEAAGDPEEAAQDREGGEGRRAERPEEE